MQLEKMGVQGPDLDADSAGDVNESRSEPGILQCGKRRSQSPEMLPVPDIAQ